MVSPRQIVAVLWRIGGDVARMLATWALAPLGWRSRQAAALLRRIEEH